MSMKVKGLIKVAFGVLWASGISPIDMGQVIKFNGEYWEVVGINHRIHKVTLKPVTV